MKEEQINNILKSVLNVSDDDISKDLGIHDVDNWDSLTHMSLIVEIENNFNIELTGDEIAEMVSFVRIKEILNFKLK